MSVIEQSNEQNGHENSCYAATADIKLSYTPLEGEQHVEIGGYFVAPTIFTNMRIFKEEIFGPVLSVICFDTPDLH